jgi:heterodisulfide reductase subunit B
MSEHMFGLGGGHLPKKISKLARQLGATLVNYTDAQCNCGYGCHPYTCKKSDRHWFTIPNLGEPFNGETAKQVLAAVGKTDQKTGR